VTELCAIDAMLAVEAMQATAIVLRRLFMEVPLVLVEDLQWVRGSSWTIKAQRRDVAGTFVCIAVCLLV
jgi:hypothetical protein